MLSDAERTLLAEIEHNRWMAERLVSGWRYGQAGPRRRPSFVPWEILQREQEAEAEKDFTQLDFMLDAFRAEGEVIERAMPHRGSNN